MGMEGSEVRNFPATIGPAMRAAKMMRMTK